LMVCLMLATFVFLRRRQSRAPTIGALLVGLVVAIIQGDMHLNRFAIEFEGRLLV